MLLASFKNYGKLPKPVLQFIKLEFVLQFLHTSFFSFLIIYLQQKGYSDAQAAGIIATRFVGVLLFAIPIGNYIKKNGFALTTIIAAWGVPIFSILIIIAIYNNWLYSIYLCQFLWGIAYSCIQTPAIPFILKNAPKEIQATGISLSYATFSLGGIVSGVFLYFLYILNPVFFTEGTQLLIVSIVSLLGIFIANSIVNFEKEQKIIKEHKETIDIYIITKQDKFTLAKALIPTTIIAMGAGLTIPYLSIFFLNVHYLPSNKFAILSAVASVLVVFASLLVPYIKTKLNYLVAVPLTQTIAIASLIGLAATQWYSFFSWALGAAIICYLIRQPLMNLAGPMTTEVVMDYVGPNNREMASALTASIWSGSWFLSSLVFKYLRLLNYSYASIFLITAVFYAVAVFWYYYLIKAHYIKQSNTLSKQI